MSTLTSPTEADQIQTQTHYDLLEVPPSATRSEIANAYQRAHAAFAPGSLATYMLFTPEEAQVVSARMETAFRVLGDANERARYDRGLGERTGISEHAGPRRRPAFAGRNARYNGRRGRGTDSRCRERRRADYGRRPVRGRYSRYRDPVRRRAT